ncbi:MAG: xanthine dehydrogenase accessory protein XdhC [Hyphomicrobiaceae bacterium]
MSLIEAEGQPAKAYVRVTIIDADGSSPREVGAAMTVAASVVDGTIGGGVLEHQAMAKARAMLVAPQAGVWERTSERIALGPSLGQCCGGAVRLLYEPIRDGERETLAGLGRAARGARGVLVRSLASGVGPRLVTERQDVGDLPRPVARVVADLLSGLRPYRAALVREWLVEPIHRNRPALHVYGAGHVGRAILQMAAPLALDITWLDTGPDRFPSEISERIRCITTPDLSMAASKCIAGGYHLVMTYSHAIDLAICEALLRRNDFAYLGLIGSATKRSRFRSRLRQGGIGDAALDRMTCPIGIEGIGGKDPGSIALATLAQIVQIAESSTARIEHSSREVAQP